MSRTQFCMYKIEMSTLALVIKGAPKQFDMGAYSLHDNILAGNQKRQYSSEIAS